MANLVSVVIPAYNEAERIADVLNDIELQRKLTGLSVEVIVVNDGSTDLTEEVVLAHPHDKLISFPQNRGRASAVQAGIASSIGNFVAVFDADYEYFPSDLFLAIKELPETEQVVVYGSRYKNPSNYSSSVARSIGRMSGQQIGPWLANWLIATYVGLLYCRWYSEHLSGIRIYPSDFVQAYKWESTGFEGDHELAAAAMLKGYKIVEVPCFYSARSKAEGKKIRATDGFKAIQVFTEWRILGKSRLTSRKL